MPEIVECYSGSNYGERPTALIWNGKRSKIIEIEDQWRTETERCFRVQTEDQQMFELRYNEITTNWNIQPV